MTGCLSKQKVERGSIGKLLLEIGLDATVSSASS